MAAQRGGDAVGAVAMARGGAPWILHDAAVALDGHLTTHAGVDAVAPGVVEGADAVVEALGKTAGYCPGLQRRSGQPEARNQVLGIAGQSLEQVPALLPRGREKRADHGEVLGTSLGAEAAGDLLPQLHHPPVALHQIVGEGHPWVGEKAEYVWLAGAEAQQQVVANPSRWTTTAPGSDGGGDQRGLCGMEGQALGEDRIVRSLDAGDQGRLERHAPVAREVGPMAGAA